MGVLSTIEQAHPRQPHWYLAVLGTDPLHQGRGIGTALMAPVLERCDEEGLPAFLESSKESNVPYYERFGFRVERELKLGKGAPSVWPMWREPQ
jgi:ribosomal protein S18 acetylase RimI-like enzyme